MTELNLKHALTDVRRAYRLVHAYQRRVLDLVSLISDTLEKKGIVFISWRSAWEYCAPPPPNNLKPFDTASWSWNLLPGFAFRNRFESRRKSPGIRPCCVWVEVWADTGFKQTANEPDPIDFPGVEACGSILAIEILQVEHVVQGILPGKVGWDEAYKAFEEGAMTGLVYGQKYTRAIGGIDFSYQCLVSNLEELPDAGAIRDRVLIPMLNALTDSCGAQSLDSVATAPVQEEPVGGDEPQAPASSMAPASEA